MVAQTHVEVGRARWPWILAHSVVWKDSSGPTEESWLRAMKECVLSCPRTLALSVPTAGLQDQQRNPGGPADQALLRGAGQESGHQDRPQGSLEHEQIHLSFCPPLAPADCQGAQIPSGMPESGVGAARGRDANFGGLPWEQAEGWGTGPRQHRKAAFSSQPICPCSPALGSF